jgi:hypothetical protein
MINNLMTREQEQGLSAVRRFTLVIKDVELISAWMKENMTQLEQEDRNYLVEKCLSLAETALRAAATIKGSP